MASGFLKITALTIGQTGKETTVNDGLTRIEHATQRTLTLATGGTGKTLTEDQFTTNFMFRLTGVSADLTLTLPDEIDSNGVNTAERVFAVENTATGDFVVTVSQDGSGTNVIVLPGEQVSMYVDGTDVKRLDNSFDIATFVAGIPTTLQLMLRFTANRTFILPIGLIGSVGSWSAVSTGAHGYIIRKNGGASLGTVDVASAAQVATFTFTVATSFGSGDVLTVEAPSTPDVTSTNMSLTLSGLKG